MKLALVVAVAENGVIGDGGDIPWAYPEDLARFKQITIGHPVIMGRKTFESIQERLGGPLPERLNIVLSRGDLSLPDGAVQADNLDAAIEMAKATGTDVAYVAGGAEVYAQVLPRADRIHWTAIHEAYEGDTRFPDFDREAWEEVEREDHGEFSFLVYERIANGG